MSLDALILLEFGVWPFYMDRCKKAFFWGFGGMLNF